MAGGGDGFLNITFEVAGQEIAQRLATWGRGITDLSQAWEQIGEDVLQDNRGNFLSEGGLYDKGWGGWELLRDATVRDRIRKGYGGEGPILQRTGALMESVTVRGGAGNVFRVSPTGVEVGTTDPKAAYHQFGTRSMFARPVVGISAQRAGWAGQAGSVVDRLNQEVRRQILLAGLQPD